MLNKNTTQARKKIKILFRLRSMETGGVQNVFLDIWRNLPKDKFEITLMLNLYQGELLSEIPKDIKLIVLAKGKEQMSKNSFIQKIQLGLRRLKLEIYDRFPTLLYTQKVKDEYDIEVSCGYAEFEMVLNSPQKSKKVGWFHTDVSYDKNLKRVQKRINLMKQFDWMVFCSAQSRQIIKDLHSVTYPNSSIIYNAIKINDARKKAEAFPVNYDTKPVFSSMGRLHSRKGYDMLVKIHKRLIDEGLTHSIVVAGGGNEMSNLQSQIKELSVEKTFILLGNQTNPFPYIKASDFFVMPTRSESYPLTIGEVMGLHKPIISTNVGGIPEMIDDGIDGILVEPNEESIYQGMKKFLTNPEFVAKIQQGTYNTDEKFDNGKIYMQLTELFEKLAKD